ncbi:MAG: hypothetical protein NTZ05_09605 [Chloroflexi bacterium]|jgi:hypothetical protein|nr:hypothetical protein [Chloroflexota bacterium]
MTEPETHTIPPGAISADAAARARRGRNIAIGIGLVGFVVLVYLVTVFRMGGNVINRPL